MILYLFHYTVYIYIIRCAGASYVYLQPTVYECMMDHVAIDIFADYIIVNIPYSCWGVRAKLNYQRNWIASLFRCEV